MLGKEGEVKGGGTREAGANAGEGDEGVEQGGRAGALGSGGAEGSDEDFGAAEERAEEEAARRCLLPWLRDMAAAAAAAVAAAVAEEGLAEGKEGLGAEGDAVAPSGGAGEPLRSTLPCLPGAPPP